MIRRLFFYILIMLYQRVASQGVHAACPAAIRLLGDDGSDARTIERMDAIRIAETMAGSPDADAATHARSASRNLAHGFCFSASMLS
jgi:hypothetical protein